MAKYMTQVRTSAMYNKAKLKFERFFDRIPKIGPPLKHKIEKSVERFRDIILEFKVGVIFEEFGFKYLGPIDGHNIPMVMAALKYAKNYNGPIMIHIVTFVSICFLNIGELGIPQGWWNSADVATV